MRRIIIEIKKEYILLSHHLMNYSTMRNCRLNNLVTHLPNRNQDAKIKLGHLLVWIRWIN